MRPKNKKHLHLGVKGFQKKLCFFHAMFIGKKYAMAKIIISLPL
jgi:hypothetical protein